MRQALMDYLVNAAWQLPLLAAGALVLARLASLNPRQRCWLWSGFLILALVLPLKLDPLPSAGADTAGASVPAAVRALPQVEALAPAVSAPAHPSLEIGAGLAQALAIAFGLALGLSAARLGAGLLAARRLVRRSAPFALAPSAAQALHAFAARHGFQEPRVRLSHEIASPVTVGVFAPVILVPEGFAHAAPEEARAALLHEAAHIQREDFGANLLCELAALPLAWHPALYPIKAGLRQARESAADALAAQAMASPELYAQCLVSLARAAGPPPRLTAAIALFGRGMLEARVRSLLAMRPKGPLAMARTLGGGLAVLAAVVAPSLLLHVTPSFAEDHSVVRLAQAAPAPLPPAAERRDPDSRSIIIDRTGGRYRHSWAAADGTRYTVANDDQAEPTADQKRRYEQQAKAAIAKGQKAIERARGEVERASRQMSLSVRTSEDQIRQAQAGVEAAQRSLVQVDQKAVAEAVARAQATLNDPQIRAAMANAQATLSDPKIRAAMAHAQATLNDPNIRAAMARAREVQREMGDGRMQRRLDRAARELNGPHGQIIINGDDADDPPEPPPPPPPPR